MVPIDPFSYCLVALFGSLAAATCWILVVLCSGARWESGVREWGAAGVWLSRALLRSIRQLGVAADGMRSSLMLWYWDMEFTASSLPDQCQDSLDW